MGDLYLVRHASHAGENPEYVVGRSNHHPLSPKGLEQARKLAQRLEDVKFDLIVSSPAMRTKQTALETIRAQGLRPESLVIADELQELSHGTWEGRRRDETYTPSVLAKLKADPYNYRPPSGGETQQEVEERMHGWIEKNIPSGPYTAIAFSHTRAIRCLLRKITNRDPSETYDISIGHTGITHLQRTNSGWKVIEPANDTAHLLEPRKL